MDNMSNNPEYSDSLRPRTDKTVSHLKNSQALVDTLTMFREQHVPTGTLS